MGFVYFTGRFSHFGQRKTGFCTRKRLLKGSCRPPAVLPVRHLTGVVFSITSSNARKRTANEIRFQAVVWING